MVFIFEYRYIGVILNSPYVNTDREFGEMKLDGWFLYSWERLG